MKAKTSFSILVWINTSRAKDGCAKLFARITVNQKRCNLSLHKKIPLESWDKHRNCLKGNTPEARQTNQYIEQTKAQLFEAYQELKAQKELITAQAIKARYLGEDERYHSVQELFQYHNEKASYNLCAPTLQHHKTSQSYFLKFIKKEYKKQDLYLKDLKYSTIQAFEYYLSTYRSPNHYKKVGHNTAMKHIQRVRKAIKIALKLEWITKDPFIRFESRLEKTNRTFLSQEELNSIQNYKTDIERIQVVKDLFIFSCYTGIAYCDTMSLTPQNILLGIDGNKWIYTQRSKTKTSVKIPILSPVQIIIDKYKDHPRTEDKGTLLPTLSNQKMNSYLKEIADVCRIKKHLTFHMARHTFATTVTLTNGVPIETVSKMLGHTKLTTTQIYAKVIERKVSQDMQQLKDVLFQKKTKDQSITNTSDLNK